MHSEDYAKGTHGRVLRCLANGPCHADEIQKRAGSFGKMIDTLADLVEAGHVVKGADHQYALTTQGKEFVTEEEARKARKGTRRQA